MIEEKYLPKEEGKHGISLCLSGGGYRAALFHLGAVRRLHELEILNKVDTISSVSGGSILSAYLMDRVQNWKGKKFDSIEWEQNIASGFRKITAKDIRTVPVLKRFLPWNWLNPAIKTKTLQEYYKKNVTQLTFNQMPEKPRFIYCATDIIFGVNWIFEKAKAGDYVLGYMEPPPSNWPVALAVTGSSCFPPVFDPMEVPIKDYILKGGTLRLGPERYKLLSEFRLSDGGVYDNMGFEPVWKDHKVVMVSDGGAPFRFKSHWSSLGRVKRCFEVMTKQSGSIRKRWLIANFKNQILNGTYWGIGSTRESYINNINDQPGYREELTKEIISNVRTDLDHFTLAEASVLENHGYLVADAAINRHLNTLVEQKQPLNIPHPNWMDENNVRNALRNSHKRFSISRLLKGFS